MFLHGVSGQSQRRGDFPAPPLAVAAPFGDRKAPGAAEDVENLEHVFVVVILRKLFLSKAKKTLLNLLALTC